MLGLYPLQSKNTASASYVRCPSCKKGRLCDRLPQTVIQFSGSVVEDMQKEKDAIILKCPKCSVQVVLTKLGNL